MSFEVEPFVADASAEATEPSLSEEALTETSANGDRLAWELLIDGEASIGLADPQSARSAAATDICSFEGQFMLVSVPQRYSIVNRT